MTTVEQAGPNAPLRIRHVRSSDLEAIAVILEAEHVNMGTQRLPFHPLSIIEARIADDPAKFKLVAEVDGQVAGYAELETWPDRPRLRHGGEIDILATHPDFRGCGVGRALLAAVVDLADRWLQLSRLQLFVWEGNDRAIRLYEDVGFSMEGRLRHFVFVDGVYRDALLMARLNPVQMPAAMTPAKPVAS
ncbi:GNAT family N-acetyltransferase [Tropicimonas marinistellae]|uniref:GNAT family N-acetyltransferase n=1 Tax=Tropicimonas marinistellae TaxID=1739787 RepID=UPI000834FF74|nr:GNAT family N-acetyltransferase [Tropicimonas marinistellae]